MMIHMCTIGGVSSTDIHTVASDAIDASGVECCRTQRLRGSPVTTSRTIERISRGIESYWHARTLRQRDFLLVGKSAGAVGAFYYAINNASRLLETYRRVAVVLVDAHGSVIGDCRLGPYCCHQNLEMPTGIDGIRWYNIYQHRRPLTGAMIIHAPEQDVINVQIADDDINHSNIPQHAHVRRAIHDAIHYLCSDIFVPQC